MFGLVGEKRQQNLTVITRKAYKGTLNQEIYIVSVSLDTKKHKESGEYQYEWKFSVGKSISKLNVTRLQVCV